MLEVKHTTHPYFHEWYHLYRRKAKKQAALKAWDKLGLETDDALRELVMQGTRRYLDAGRPMRRTCGISRTRPPGSIIGNGKTISPPPPPSR